MDTPTPRPPLTSIAASASSALATPSNPGIEWVRDLRAHEIDRLRRVANDGSSTMPGDATYMIDFVRYLIDAIKRAQPDLYSISNYQLAEEIAKLLTGKTPTPASNPDYSMRVSVAETDLVKMRGELAALKESLSDLREEMNHKDQLWGKF